MLPVVNGRSTVELSKPLETKSYLPHGRKHDREVMLKSFCNEQYNAEVGSVYGDDVDDVLCDCIIITDDNDRSNFGMCKMGNYFYAIGGYNTSVIKTVIRFDGKKWERICDISVPRSALRVALLIAWPDPVQLLYNASKKSRDGHNTSSNTESSESSEISNLKIVPVNDDLD
ncbi:Kelch-like ECH-associated protein 1B [Dirofilaria immitis]